jgi:hypothetical protein
MKPGGGRWRHRSMTGAMIPFSLKSAKRKPQISITRPAGDPH